MAVVFDIPSGSSVDTHQAIGVTVDNTAGLVIGAGPDTDDDALEFVFAPPPGSLPGAEGVFLFPYSTSTREGIDNTHFTLRRKGGMPEGWRYRVFEAPPAPSAGQTWGKVYEVDLTAQSSQNMSAAGSYTIDGKVWWAKGSIGSGGYNQLVNGQGLGIGVGDNIDLAARANFRTVANHDHRSNCLDFAQIEDFNPNAMWAITLRWSGLFPASTDTTKAAAFVVGAVAADVNGITSAEKNGTLYVDWYKYRDDPPSNLLGVLDLPNYTTPTAHTGTGSYVTNYTELEAGLMCIQPGRFIPLSKPWSGAQATPDQMTADSALIKLQGAVAATPSFCHIMQKAFSGAGTAWTCYLTRFTLWQPRIAP